MKCELCNEEGKIWLPSATEQKEFLIGEKCHTKIQQHSVLRTIQLKKGVNFPTQQRVRVSMIEEKVWIRSYE